MNIFILLIIPILANAVRYKTKYGYWEMQTTDDGLTPNNPSFMVDEQNQQFLLDGQPFRYISGSIHYFRIPITYWKDRLSKVRALGFNAIQYYIPWNFHELEEGKFEFSGVQDFTEFSKIAQKMGLWTILRIGPYSCGEWENGGLPAWILTKNVTKQRSSDPVFIDAVKKWFDVLLPRLKPLLRKNGGPVLMLQIENEYGSYDACDKEYLRFLRDYTRQLLGDGVLLFTTDGSSENLLKCGSVEEVLTTVDFGPTDDKEEIQKYLDVQRKFDPSAPYVNSEYYPGWLVLWGQKEEHLPATETIINGAKAIYELGGNLNFYMIHGGTNFGFWNGAETEAACITSYDYSAPITEAGDVTRNYLEIRKWIKGLKDWPTQPQDVPENNPKKAFGKIKTRKADRLMENEAGTCATSEQPLSFETLDNPLGLVAYLANITKCGNLTIPSFGDFVYVYLNAKYMGTLYRHFYNSSMNSLVIDGCKENETNILFLLVENQGRITYETLNDYKGILSDVLLDSKPIIGWNQCGSKLPLGYTNGWKHFKKSSNDLNQKQGVFVGELNVDKPTDTWFDSTGWGKGIVIVNGHNVGRYWATVGPQITLYIPAEFFKTGSNLIMIVELEGGNEACSSDASCVADFIDHPIFKYSKVEYHHNMIKPWEPRD